MNSITITLTVTHVEARAIMDLLETHRHSNFKVPTANDLPKKVEIPIDTKSLLTDDGKVLPSPGKKTIMPSFGRTPTQIAEFIATEETRVDLRNEEAELKAQRAEEREALKADKAQEALLKKQVADKLQNEVKAIVQAEIPTTTTTLKPPPWKL
jgi:hypothetical protein